MTLQLVELCRDKNTDNMAMYVYTVAQLSINNAISLLTPYVTKCIPANAEAISTKIYLVQKALNTNSCGLHYLIVHCEKGLICRHHRCHWRPHNTNLSESHPIQIIIIIIIVIEISYIAADLKTIIYRFAAFSKMIRARKMLKMTLVAHSQLIYLEWEQRRVKWKTSMSGTKPTTGLS